MRRTVYAETQRKPRQKLDRLCEQFVRGTLPVSPRHKVGNYVHQWLDASCTQLQPTTFRRL